MGFLSRYSLADAMEGSSSHSMHSVLHRWCRRLAEGEERYALGCIATGIVASNVPGESEAEFWRKRKRLLGHAVDVSGWVVGMLSMRGEMSEEMIQAWMYHDLGYLLAGEDRLEEAEAMYERALRGYEKALGVEHTSTLTTVNNLGLLYADQGRLDKAEDMYERALRGYEKATKPENLPTYIPALNTMWGFASLRNRQHRVEEARARYSKALLGYESVMGTDHPNCHSLRSSLAALDARQDESSSSQAESSVQRTSKAPPASTEAEEAKVASKRHRLLKRFKWKGR